MDRGEVWLLNPSPTIGAEIQKTRPVIVISSNYVGALPLRVIVPLTDWKDDYSTVPWMVKINPDKINGLSKPSGADCFQIKSLSTDRFIRKIGMVSKDELDNIARTIGFVIEIPTS
jgi:mRNA interferase MazF